MLFAVPIRSVPVLLIFLSLVVPAPAADFAPAPATETAVSETIPAAGTPIDDYPRNWRDFWIFFGFAVIAISLAVRKSRGLSRAEARFEILSRDGMAALLTGRYDEAEKLLSAAQRKARHFGSKDLRTATSFANLALVHDFRNRPAKTEACLRKSIEITENALGANHSRLAKPLEDYGVFLNRQGREKEAHALEERVDRLAARREVRTNTDQ